MNGRLGARLSVKASAEVTVSSPRPLSQRIVLTVTKK